MNPGQSKRQTDGAARNTGKVPAQPLGTIVGRWVS